MKVELGHEKEFRVDTRFVQAETNLGVLFLGSTGLLLLAAVSDADTNAMQATRLPLQEDCQRCNIRACQ